MNTPLPQDLSAAIARLSQCERVVVASDFDGVLAPFTSHPLASRAAPGTIEALRAAAALPGVTVAAISGRDIETLVLLTGIGPGEGVRLFGSHGAQSTEPGGLLDLLTAPQARTLAALDSAVREIAARHTGTRVEGKPGSVVLHTRDVDQATADAAAAEAMRAAGQLPGVHILPGKSVVELSVVEVDKGTALVGLARSVDAQRVVYLGDDVTDERAFTALGPDDVTIKVGPGDTAAHYRIDGLELVLPVLRAVLAALTPAQSDTL